MIGISKSKLRRVKRRNLSVISHIPWRHATMTQQLLRYYGYCYTTHVSSK